MSRKKYIIGNWKMHKTAPEAASFLKAFDASGSRATIGLAVPFTIIHAISGVLVGAQTISEHTHGAYTGEISAEMVLDEGASFTLIGHSERRTLYGETDEVIHTKIKRALDVGLLPILCVGETEEEHAAGKAKEVLERQLSHALKGVSPSQLVIAYEPVWAIGTGKTATPDIAQGAHKAIRAFLRSPDVSIIYGGSVKPNNIAELMSEPDIDGALVGGASLDPHTFHTICTQGIS